MIVAGLTDTVRKWGIQILRVEIQELKTDNQTSAVMLQQLEAERKSRALSSEAEGQAQATVKAASAERDYLDTLSASVGAEEAAKPLLAQKVIEGLERISRNPADKVFLPSSLNGVLELTTGKAERAS